MLTSNKFDNFPVEITIYFMLKGGAVGELSTTINGKTTYLAFNKVADILLNTIPQEARKEIERIITEEEYEAINAEMEQEENE